MSDHSNHEVSVQPDADNLEYRPFCHDCERFLEWDESEMDKYA